MEHDYAGKAALPSLRPGTSCINGLSNRHSFRESSDGFQ
jgi:hypothetical protein